MVYNVNYLISAMIFLLLILYHFLGQRKLDERNSKTFLFFLIVGLMDVLLDFLCTILITMARPGLCGLLELLLVILYLLQILVPVAFYGYIHRLRNLTDRQWFRRMTVASIPAVVMAVVVLSNHWHGWLFTVTKAGVYIRGPLYLGMYLLALCYVGAVALGSVLYAKQFGRKTVGVIWEFLLLAGTCAVIQMIYNDILMTSFGIALGISVLFLTINNPYGYTDSLTGVYDRKYFHEFLQPMIGRQRALHCVGVDVTCLRRINRMYGAEAGDSLLRQVASLLRGPDSSIWVFRFGGSQFLAVVKTLREYEMLLKSAKAFSNSTIQLGGNDSPIALTVSGVMNCEEMGTCETIVAYIEYLNSLAPEKESSFLVQSSAETLRGFHYQQMVEDYLPAAIREDKFTVHYQPVYSIREGRYISLEALSRLRHPQLGYISPEVFIAAAERANCMTQIGLLQIHRICAFIRENRDRLPGIRNVKINLSPSELLNVQYCHQIIRVIRESGVDPSFLHIEVTESLATEYEEALYKIVGEFTQAGIGLCMDDFGAGYANLNAVLQLPFSIIKMDRSMLTNICENERNSILLEGIIRLCRSLGYQTVAEGVETKEELDKVTQLGIDMIQGYYFSRPLEAGSLLELLKGNGY